MLSYGKKVITKWCVSDFKCLKRNSLHISFFLHGNQATRSLIRKYRVSMFSLKVWYFIFVKQYLILFIVFSQRVINKWSQWQRLFAVWIIHKFAFLCIIFIFLASIGYNLIFSKKCRSYIFGKCFQCKYVMKVSKILGMV